MIGNNNILGMIDYLAKENKPNELNNLLEKIDNNILYASKILHRIYYDIWPFRRNNKSIAKFWKIIIYISCLIYEDRKNIIKILLNYKKNEYLMIKY